MFISEKLIYFLVLDGKSQIQKKSHRLQSKKKNILLYAFESWKHMRVVIKHVNVNMYSNQQYERIHRLLV